MAERVSGGQMSLSDAEITANSIMLGEHETTGLLPVGFEFERYGAKYDHFDVSTDGFITFARGTRHAGLPGRVSLAGEGTRLGGGRVTYEVRGVAPRRRLMVSLEEGPAAAAVRVTVHERTGIVEVGSGAQSFGEPTIRQLDMVHSSRSRANSARKIG
jgi:hypothetical protein